MLKFIYHALLDFRPLFSRHRSWLLFSAIILSFMATPEMIGVTSICRFWLCGESGYNSLLHAFRSKAYDYGELVMAWQRFVVRQGIAVVINGRHLVLGDHTDAVKD